MIHVAGERPHARQLHTAATVWLPGHARYPFPADHDGPCRPAARATADA